MNRVKVLFLCNHNSARSQMAEGLLRSLYGNKYDAFSAGASPMRVNPLAIRVMAEIGVDISGQRSKSVEEFRGKDIDLVVSVCENSVKVICPFCSSPMVGDRPEIIGKTLRKAKRYLHHPFTDPSEVEGSEEEKLKAFRRTRDNIRQWIIDYFASYK
jgi:arsenate reductase